MQPWASCWGFQVLRILSLLMGLFRTTRFKSLGSSFCISGIDQDEAHELGALCYTLHSKVNGDSLAHRRTPLLVNCVLAVLVQDAAEACFYLSLLLT